MVRGGRLGVKAGVVSAESWGQRRSGSLSHSNSFQRDVTSVSRGKLGA